MQISEYSLPIANKLVNDYVHHTKDMSCCYDYSIHEKEYVKKRFDDLQGRVFPRSQLSDYLSIFHSQFPIGEKTRENIRKLANDNTYVVIGGQQAGLLTGPLYSIHKITSIIQLAKKYEQELGVDVVPVFWIAGEDHDLQEINHVHVEASGHVKKKIFYQREERTIASETVLNEEQCRKWIDEVVKTYGETMYTKEVRALLQEAVRDSHTYVDFFAHLVCRLFKKEGLVLIDSGDAGLREIEAPYFSKMVHAHEQVAEAFVRQQQHLITEGYQPIIQAKDTSMHLFIQQDGERHLLEKVGEDLFQTKDGKMTFTYTQLSSIAEQSPHLLSNNVVTRPLMQEYLFPTLAFVAGHGEVAYWGELKQVFEAHKMKMPPIMPRQMITIIEPSVQKALIATGLELEEVLRRGVEPFRVSWLQQQSSYDIESEFVEAESQLNLIHEKLREVATSVNPALEGLAEKNYKKITEQVAFLQRTIEKEILLRHDVEMKKFDQIDRSIWPLGIPQERVWNIFYYLNKYGVSFIDQLVTVSLEWNHKQKVLEI
ncbi:bacillithiol biosynthesis cysteine-adding enzyme BshC [Priestia taiwanensis]|uniref:Putative cysteine ligase BshC n=1 Tax=Priestia taiwanensis TaxID=1347902 RepID=A0A917AQD1_9BACI|nr:bacillithiol biosynthesis cysteine-adding enzyme BshC [Priestia taiwanensis]MBM7362943.1 bacillithiol biosynthesis cysteine-adding enzyme BshC [Priestia taiwanensis]GGE66343.1 putative cysteine ligase BshC [Priestia taiwanensis]